MFLDGVEYRETRVFSFIYPHYRGWHLIHRKDSDADAFSCYYNSDKMVSENGDVASVIIWLSVPSDVFESGKVFYSDDQDVFQERVKEMNVSTNMHLGTITSWKLSVMIDSVINSQDYSLEGFINDSYSGRYEYEMTMVDSLGISHQVTGWAEYIE